MAVIALDGNKFTDVANASNHITCTTRDWDSCYYWSYELGCTGGDWDYTYNVSVPSTCKGTIKGDTTSVYANSKKLARQSGQTTETDNYTAPSNIYGGVSGSHSDTSGLISDGNSRNVYAQGRLIAVKGGSITTHSSRSTSISEGSSNVYIGG